MIIISPMITILCIRASGLIHLLVASLYLNISPIPPPSTPSNSILLCFYEFCFFLYLYSTTTVFLSIYIIYIYTGSFLCLKLSSPVNMWLATPSHPSGLCSHFTFWSRPPFKLQFTLSSQYCRFSLLCCVVVFSIVCITCLYTMQLTYLLCLLSVSLPINCELHENRDLFLSYACLHPWHRIGTQ